MWEVIRDNLVQIICAGAASFVVGTLVRIMRQFKSLAIAVRANGHDRLFRYGQFYIETNQITFKEMETLTEIYQGYHGLGGNGTGTEIFQKCKELPVVKTRTEWNPYYVERK